MVQNEILKLAVFLLDHVHHWILLLINYSEKASEQFKNRAWILASYETYSSQDTASTTAVVEVAVAICSLLCGTTAAEPLTQRRWWTMLKNMKALSKVKFNSKLLKDERFRRFSKHRSMYALRIFSKL